MSVKFVKSIIFLNDSSILAEMVELDLLSHFSEVVASIKAGQKNVTMLQSAVLEFINMFCEYTKSVLDSSTIEPYLNSYRDTFKLNKNLLPKLFTTR